MHSEDQLLPLRINLAKVKEDVGLKKSPNKIKLSYVFGKGQIAKKDLFTSTIYFI